MLKELIIKNYKGINVTDSREVSEMIGKKHDNLLRDIRGYIKVIEESSKLRSQDFFIESIYKNSQNKSQPCYLLTKQGCEMVANKMTGEKGILFTAEYVQAFNKMEQNIKEMPKRLSAIEQIKLQNEALIEIDGKVEDLGERISIVENNMTIDYGQQLDINNLAKKKVVEVLGGKDTPAYKELNKKAFSQIWKDYKRIMQVNSYKNTSVKDLTMAKRVINDWQPNRDLELMIRGCNAQIRM